ncbi:MAG: dTMP kinase [Deltaproteobacteria bacterium]|nr:dTMP kinase [Deltaproteobacteria bacterium]MBI4794422.1 dTMP kinase [Deltaproteobacteria bacterium]
MIKFLAIEGLDGSGKSTQINLLINHLSKVRIPCKFLHFPRFDEGLFGNLIAKFLKGDFGPVDKVDPYIVALLFALDRYDAKKQMINWIKNDYFILVDRYVYSNIAFQCAKIKEINLKLELEKWILDLEYSYFKIPKPELSIYLHVPFSFVKKELLNPRVGKDRKYLEGKLDIHESSLELQRNVQEEYLRLTKDHSDFLLIDCHGKDDTILKKKDIHSKLIKYITSKE